MHCCTAMPGSRDCLPPFRALGLLSRAAARQAVPPCSVGCRSHGKGPGELPRRHRPCSRTPSSGAKRLCTDRRCARNCARARMQSSNAAKASWLADATTPPAAAAGASGAWSALLPYITKLRRFSITASQPFTVIHSHAQPRSKAAAAVIRAPGLPRAAPVYRALQPAPGPPRAARPPPRPCPAALPCACGGE